MAEASELTEVWRDGRLMGRGRRTANQEISVSGLGQLRVHFFPVFELAPPVMFEHLSGRGLTAFLDRGLVKPPKGDGHIVRYVHGRSEVMRGNPRVSSVLLAEMPEQPNLDDASWMMYLPKIYKHFLKEYDPT